MSNELITILLAMSPTLEAHGALVTALGVFKFSSLKAFLLSSLGSTLLIVPLLFFWHFLADFFMKRFYIINRFMNWLFTYTKNRHGSHFGGFEEGAKESRVDFWKAFALYVFVAIPGPFTGVWAGTVAAFVFGIPFWHAVVALFLGALSVTLIDLLVITGFIHIFG